MLSDKHRGGFSITKNGKFKELNENIEKTLKLNPNENDVKKQNEKMKNLTYYLNAMVKFINENPMYFNQLPSMFLTEPLLEDTYQNMKSNHNMVGQTEIESNVLDNSSGGFLMMYEYMDTSKDTIEQHKIQLLEQIKNTVYTIQMSQ